MTLPVCGYFLSRALPICGYFLSVNTFCPYALPVYGPSCLCIFAVRGPFLPPSPNLQRPTKGLDSLGPFFLSRVKKDLRALRAETVSRVLWGCRVLLALWVPLGKMETR